MKTIVQQIDDQLFVHFKLITRCFSFYLKTRKTLVFNNNNTIINIDACKQRFADLISL